MRYLLVVLTHGDKATLSDTLDSFAEHVQPAESEAAIVFDSAEQFEHDRTRLRSLAPLLRSTRGPLGFCGATRLAWGIAAESSRFDYVFWLEHDFVFIRPVDLREPKFVLDQNPQLAQMQFMRDATNPDEAAAGGLFESRRGQYWPHSAFFDRFKGDPGKLDTPHEMYEQAWLEHRSYLTTNPSLMRREFMATHPWPAYPDQCEGRFGIDLAQAGFTFGVWGSGEPWVKHVGVRSGFGY